MSEPELEGFDVFLSECPGLGPEHPVGREILDAMQSLPRTTLGESRWFRAIECAARPQSTEFLPPDSARVVVPEQRFNHQGQRVFYLSDSDRGAALECRQNHEAKIWVQGFRALSVANVLDFKTDGDSPKPRLARLAATYTGSVDERIRRPASSKPEYRVPRFVADCARRLGVAALLVPSVEHGTNLAVLRWSQSDFIAAGEPRHFGF